MVSPARHYVPLNTVTDSQTSVPCLKAQAGQSLFLLVYMGTLYMVFFHLFRLQFASASCSSLGAATCRHFTLPLTSSTSAHNSLSTHTPAITLFRRLNDCCYGQVLSPHFSTWCSHTLSCRLCGTFHTLRFNPLFLVIFILSFVRSYPPHSAYHSLWRLTDMHVPSLFFNFRGYPSSAHLLNA